MIELTPPTTPTSGKVTTSAREGNIIKLSVLSVPSLALVVAANAAAVYGGIQALTLIPSALHLVVIILGFIMLVPLNMIVVPIGMGIGILLYSRFCDL